MILDFGGLLEHQPQGVEFLAAHPRAMLAWDMRLGKTATAARAWECDPRGQMLVLCPATARENWRREILRHCIDPQLPPNVQVIKSAHDKLSPASDVVIVNYDKLDNPNVANAIRNNCDRRWWGTIVCDEARYLKSAKAKRTQQMYGGAKSKRVAPPLIDFCERVWLLDGTPMPNHPGELWTHCYYLWPEAIQHRWRPMNEWEFQMHYCQVVQGEYGMKIVGGKNLTELRERLTPYVHRLKYETVFPGRKPMIDTWPLDMEATSGKRWPDMPELVAKLSQRFGNVADIEKFDDATLDAYLTAINCEHDALASLRRETGTLKAVATALLARHELENGGPKTIVFAWHHDAIDTLAKGLKAFNPAVLHGGVPAGARMGIVDKFNDDPTCKVFIGQIQTAGQAIDLSAAQQIIFAELSWTPGDNAQASLRASGPRQRSNVSVRAAYLPGSIDENVVRALTRKTAAITATFG